MRDLMHKELISKKSFLYNEKTIYYFVKNIEWQEVRGKEMASALIVVCDENDTQNDVFAVYDERYKVMYAIPDDVKRWYEEYLSEKSH